MKFTVTLDDFWIDEDGDVESELRDHIVQDTFRQINESIRPLVQKAIDSKLDAIFREKLDTKIHNLIEEVISSDKKTERYGEELVTVKEFFTKDFMRTFNRTSYSPNNIKNLAEGLGKEIKSRYDLAFASQLVSKLNDVGMLKDDVAKLILEK